MANEEMLGEFDISVTLHDASSNVVSSLIFDVRITALPIDPKLHIGTEWNVLEDIPILFTSNSISITALDSNDARSECYLNLFIQADRGLVSLSNPALLSGVAIEAVSIHAISLSGRSASISKAVTGLQYVTLQDDDAPDAVHFTLMESEESDIVEILTANLPIHVLSVI